MNAITLIARVISIFVELRACGSERTGEQSEEREVVFLNNLRLLIVFWKSCSDYLRPRRWDRGGGMLVKKLKPATDFRGTEERWLFNFHNG